MKLFGYEIRKNEVLDKEFRSIYDTYEGVFGGLSYGTYTSFQASKALTLSAVYRAVNLIGDAIASLQMKVYQVDKDGYKSEDYGHNLYSFLAYEPNPMMSRYDFFKMIINSMLLRGNAYVKINRDSNFNISSLEFLNPDLVSIQSIKGDIKYIVSGIQGMINNSDMVHIRNFPQVNTLYGISTISYAMNTLDISYSSEKHAGNWFKGGANSAAFLTADNGFTKEQKVEIIASLKNMSSTDTGNPNGVSVLGGLVNAKIQTMGVSPRDSQLLETRAFNILDIARFFSVSPVLLFDNTKATYANSEHAQLDFLNTTLLPIIEKMENEFVRKLILPSKRVSTEIRFDLSNLLRADMNSQADYYTKLFSIGVMNANQIARNLNLPKIQGEGGDRYCISTNLQDSNNLIVNQTNSIDNKVIGKTDTTTTTLKK